MTQRQFLAEPRAALGRCVRRSNRSVCKINGICLSYTLVCLTLEKLKNSFLSSVPRVGQFSTTRRRRYWEELE
jgi:hypothetical protein